MTDLDYKSVIFQNVIDKIIDNVASISAKVLRLHMDLTYLILMRNDYSNYLRSTKTLKII